MKGPLQIEINKTITRENIRLLKKELGSTEMLAVLKEDAYGHGMLEMAQICQEEGVDGIALIFVNEGVYLRQEGITLPIYLLGRALTEEIPTAIKYNLIYPLSTLEDIETTALYLNENPSANAKASLALNTGMNRYGFHKKEALKACQRILEVERLTIEQVYTHLTHADDCIDPYSLEQYKEFEETLKELPLKGFKRSIANSAATLRYPQMRLDQVRIGCLLHGLAPIDGEPLPSSLPLKTSYRCTTFVNHVHQLKKGQSISYGRTYTTNHDTMVATIAGGYGCGIAKSLSNNGEVLIQGERYPIIGRICMSQFMIDLGPTTTIKPGETVTLLGYDGDEHIDIFDHAARADRNFLEILMNLSAHNTQHFID